MNLGISGLFVQPGQVGGAEHMLRNLVSGLSAIRSEHHHTRLFVNPGWYEQSLTGVDRVNVPAPKLANRFITETFWLPFHARGCDSMLFPNYFLPPTVRTAFNVSVIHDVQYRAFPNNFSRSKRAWLRMAHEYALRRADRVVAISEFTKGELISRHGDWARDRINVIRNPIRWDRFDQAPVEEELRAIPEERFALTVAAHYPHKNLSTLVRAFAELRRRSCDLKLVIAGQLPHRLRLTVEVEDIRTLIKELGLDQRVYVTGYVSDAMMGELYRKAQLFVFPSLYEGFGMPPVEALGVGVPVLATRLSSVPEVTQGLATYIDSPQDPGEWADKILEMSSYPARYAPSEDEISELRREYEIKKTAQEYLELLGG